MKFARVGLIVAASLLALSVAQAKAQTLEVGDSIQVPMPWTTAQMSDLTGTGKLAFSNPLIRALNTFKVTFVEVAPAEVTAPYTPATTTYPSDGAVHVTAPVQKMTADFGIDAFTVNEVQTVGGATQITIKNGATTGAGNLTISNLRAVIGDRPGFGGTIYADLSSTTEGFSNRTDYALWTFDQLIGATTYAYPPLLGGHERIDMTHSLHGLFLVNSTEGKSLFQQALSLNLTGLSMLSAVDNPLSLTNIDPITNSVAGWGSITSSMSVIVSVPEPATCALTLAGVVGVGLLARHRASR